MRPRRTSLAALLLAAPLLLVGCSSDDPGDETLPTPSPGNPCPDIPAEGFASELPDGCAPTGEPSDDATDFPDDPNSVSAVTLEPVKGVLGGANNRDDATKKTAMFSVTVPAGSRIGSVVGCLGDGTVTLETVPDSKAYQEITCNADPTLYSELITEDDVVLKAATTFQVKVTASAGSRWDVAVFGCTTKVGECQA